MVRISLAEVACGIGAILVMLHVIHRKYQGVIVFVSRRKVVKVLCILAIVISEPVMSSVCRCKWIMRHLP